MFINSIYWVLELHTYEKISIVFQDCLSSTYRRHKADVVQSSRSFNGQHMSRLIRDVPAR